MNILAEVFEMLDYVHQWWFGLDTQWQVAFFAVVVLLVRAVFGHKLRPLVSCGLLKLHDWRYAQGEKARLPRTDAFIAYASIRECQYCGTTSSAQMYANGDFRIINHDRKQSFFLPTDQEELERVERDADAMAKIRPRSKS